MSGGQKKLLTVKEVLDKTADYFKEKKIENSRFNAELLLAHVLNMRRIDLYLNFDRPLIEAEIAELRKLIVRRIKREPLQYILGQTEFYSLPIHLTPAVLIPRPETEILVQKVIDHCRSLSAEEIQILDVGTGSGCIAVALAKNVTNAVVTAVDVSAAALEVARGNAVLNEVDVRFFELDALKPWPPEFLGVFDVVVSNPPYVSYSEYQHLQPEVRDYEPKISLLGGNDGLEFYRRFALHCASLLKPQGSAFFEIGDRQAVSVRNIFAEAGFENLKIFDDLAGRNRVITMQWNRSSL